MRKFLTLFVAAAALLLFPVFAWARVPQPGDPGVRVAKFWIGKKFYTVGNQVYQMDAAPFIQNSRTFVPVRYLALALGVSESNIYWDQKEQSVALRLNRALVILKVGSKSIHTFYDNADVHFGNADGWSKKQTDVAPLVKDRRMYLPAKWVAEAFGYEVSWNAGTRAALIYRSPGKIDMIAAYSGSLQPPAGAIAPPGKQGFPPKAVKMEFKVGSRYAKVTRPDGSTYTLDLGVLSKVVADPEMIESLKQNWSDIYNDSNTISLPKANHNPALYIPFIPVAEAFGIPKENIVWDGRYLAVFGCYGDLRKYCVIGSKQGEDLVFWDSPSEESMTTWPVRFPPFEIDGEVMISINEATSSHLIDLLFTGILDAEYDENSQCFSVGNEIAEVACKPHVR